MLSRILTFGMILCMLLVFPYPMRASASVVNGRQYSSSKAEYDVVYCPYTHRYWVKLKNEHYLTIGKLNISLGAEWNVYTIDADLSYVTYMFTSQYIIYDMLPTENGLIFTVERPIQTVVDVKQYNDATKAVTMCIPTYVDSVLAYSSGNLLWQRGKLLYKRNLSTDRDTVVTTITDWGTWDQNYYYFTSPDTGVPIRLNLETLQIEDYDGIVPTFDIARMFYGNYWVDIDQGLLTIDGHEIVNISEITAESVLAIDDSFLCGFSNKGEVKYLELDNPQVVNSLVIPLSRKGFSLANNHLFFLDVVGGSLIWVNLHSTCQGSLRIPE